MVETVEHHLKQTKIEDSYITYYRNRCTYLNTIHVYIIYIHIHIHYIYTPTREKQPLEDVSPIKNGNLQLL